MADDLVQMACERALANEHRFEAGTRFDAWMFRILRNLWIDDIRKRKTAGPQEDIDERHDIAGVSGEREMEARLTLNSVAQAIGDLADDQREVLLLVCVEELSYRDAAEVLAVPIGTVMSRLARARKNWRRRPEYPRRPHVLRSSKGRANDRRDFFGRDADAVRRWRA